MAHLHGHREEKRKWLARLSKSKQRDVLQLEGRAGSTRNPEMCEFSDELDNLIPFRGLWPGNGNVFATYKDHMGYYR